MENNDCLCLGRMLELYVIQANVHAGGDASIGLVNGAMTSSVESAACASAAPQAAAFQADFVRNVIDEALEDFKDQMRQDVLNLQMEMLKHFQIQQVSLTWLLYTQPPACLAISVLCGAATTGVVIKK